MKYRPGAVAPGRVSTGPILIESPIQFVPPADRVSVNLYEGSVAGGGAMTSAEPYRNGDNYRYCFNCT
jgi:hypothetical protein